MKKFDMITEGEARGLERGETVVLARGGHVTPLARDTLRQRGVILVCEEKLAEGEAELAPPASVRSVAVASDHAGTALRRALVPFLRGRGVAVHEVGAERASPFEYPDAAEAAAELVARREVDAAIVVDGGGIGSAIAANKITGIRAAMATTETVARYSREHNGANVLTLGSTFVDESQARAIVATWIATPMREPRYIRRLAKIRALERRQPHS